MFEKMSSDGFFLRVVFLKLVFDFFFRRLGSTKWIWLGDVIFPSMGISCLVSSSNLSKSSSNSESVLVLVTSNSGFLRESDFFELVDEVIEFAAFCGFKNFWGVSVNWAAFEAA